MNVADQIVGSGFSSTELRNKAPGHSRYDAIGVLKSDAIAQWKVHSDYHVRAIFETVILRSKGVTSGE